MCYAPKVVHVPARINSPDCGKIKARLLTQSVSTLGIEIVEAEHFTGNVDGAGQVSIATDKL
jgi:hypothetical protein